MTWTLIEYLTPVIFWLIEKFVLNRRQQDQAKARYLKMISEKKDFGKRGVKLREDYREIFENIDQELRKVQEDDSAESNKSNK